MENHDTLKFNKHDSADASAIFTVLIELAAFGS